MRLHATEPSGLNRVRPCPPRGFRSVCLEHPSRYREILSWSALQEMQEPAMEEAFRFLFASRLAGFRSSKFISAVTRIPAPPLLFPETLLLSAHPTRRKLADSITV